MRYLNAQPLLMPIIRKTEAAGQNPVIIPRNHAVQAALDAASQRQEWAPFHALLTALQTPYREDGAPESLSQPPPPGTPRCRTFCGT